MTDWRPPADWRLPGEYDVLSNTFQGFSLRSIKHLVLDEADRLLNMDFEADIDAILKVTCLGAEGGSIPHRAHRGALCVRGSRKFMSWEKMTS